ncbi:MAG TPA: heme-binding domain-containing protein [Ginsengibacter sp.]
MKKVMRTVLIVLLIALIIIQFIRPKKNISEGIAVNDISSKYAIPNDVNDILKVSCYDCHSNNTVYPWYWNIQPVMWFMNGHVEEGKRHLNFSIFTTYAIARQYKIFDNINKEVKSGDMPLSSYTLIHRDAIISDTQKAAILNWTTTSRKQIEDNYPPDSLILKKRVRP